MSRAKVHSAGVAQSEGRGMASPYSTEGYWRNARWAKTALKNAAAHSDAPANLRRFLMVSPSRLFHWTQRPLDGGKMRLEPVSTELTVPEEHDCWLLANGLRHENLTLWDDFWGPLCA